MRASTVDLVDRTTAILAADMHHHSRQEVKRTINAFLQAIRKTVDEGYRVTMSGFGIFEKNDWGEVELTVRGPSYDG